MSTINIGDLTTHEVTDLRQLVDVDRLQQIQDEFAAETGLAMIPIWAPMELAAIGRSGRMLFLMATS